VGYFPLFFDLSNKTVLIAGGGKVAERKLRTLMEFSASVLLVSPDATPEILRLASSGKIRYVKRKYHSEDMIKTSLAVAATGDRQVNIKIHQDAVSAGIPVNVVDDPELCTFIFPAIVKRDDFVAGITTSGSYPALSKYAREKMEIAFPKEYETVMAILKGYRLTVRKEIDDIRQRKMILEKLLQAAVSPADENGFCKEALKLRLDQEYDRLKTALGVKGS